MVFVLSSERCLQAPIRCLWGNCTLLLPIIGNGAFSCVTHLSPSPCLPFYSHPLLFSLLEKAPTRAAWLRRGFEVENSRMLPDTACLSVPLCLFYKDLYLLPKPLLYLWLLG